MATKSSSRSKTKKSSSRGKRTTKKEQQARKQMYAVLLFALGILLFCLAAVPGENVWLAIHQFLLGCFSWCGYLVGPIIIYAAVMVAMDQTGYPIAAKVISSLLLILLLCGTTQVFSREYPESALLPLIQELFEKGKDLEGGGVAGIFFGVPLLHWFSFTGAAITIVLLDFVAVMLLSGGTLVGLFRNTVVKPVQKMEEVYTSVSEARETARAAAAAQPSVPKKKDRLFNINVDLEGGDDTQPARPKKKKEPPAPTAQEDRDKLLEAARGLDAPTQSSGKEKKREAKGVPGLYDFDAHEPKPPAKPVSGAELQQAGVVPARQTEPDPIPAGAPQKEEELTLEDIITRAVSGEVQVPQPPVLESGSGLLDFGEEKPAAPAEKGENKPEEKQRSGSSGEAPSGQVLRPEYTFPPMTLLGEGKTLPRGDTTKELKANADRLVDTLKSFGVQTRIVDITRGPAVTRYELQPSAGVKISKITNLADDIALNLAAAGVRIEAPIPNKAAIGIEVPNKIVSTVPIREILDSQEFEGASSRLTVALGKDIAGSIALADIGKMPHLLIAGATGSGKSVCINSIIISLLYKARPEEVKLLMVDPKVVELGGYNGIPHLLSPVVTDPKKAAGALCTMVGEMLRRYQLFADNSVRDLKGYNRLAAEREDLEPLPQIVIIIDELADLMMASPKDVEDYICRLAQMARAAGMHLIIATQRPSVDVITGVIKANIPSRISFAVSSQIDSRTILDMGGAEKLLGTGDMLFYPVGSPKPTRVQGCFVTDQEVEAVVDFIKESSTAAYDQQLMEEIERNAAAVGGKGSGSGGSNNADGEEEDELLQSAIEVVIEGGQASTSHLQRRLKVGYARAARLMDEMEQRGIVGPPEGSKPRQILLTKERWYEMKMNQAD